MVGLGNFGDQYINTKHNVGFMFIDYYLKQNNITLNNKFVNGIYTSIINSNNVLYIAKPLTYMNLSGEFVSKFIQYYKIPISNILIIYDDMDLVLGTYKFKSKGSSGGQNGIKNIINLLKTEEIKRIKIGISKPRNKNDVINYVLSKFNESEIRILNNIFCKISNAIDEFTINDFEKIMSKFN